MPDTPPKKASRLARLDERLRELDHALSYVFRNSLLNAAAVLGLALLLNAAGLGLQAVVGAFVILYARRLSEKRLAHRDKPSAPTAERTAAYERTFGPVRDPMGEALSDWHIRSGDD